MPALFRNRVFRLCAVFALASATFHAVSMVSPAVARLEYEPTYPPSRHLVFIGINLALVWLFLRRPRWFVFAFALLTAQILNGHGRAAWALWRMEGRLEWISIVVSAGALVILALLIVDRHAAIHSGSLPRL